MPCYEYRCEHCGMLIEVKHLMKENPAVECPRCRRRAKKLISGGSGYILKRSDLPNKGHALGSRCGKERTCCGSATPCDTKPCDIQ